MGNQQSVPDVPCDNPIICFVGPDKSDILCSLTSAINIGGLGKKIDLVIWHEPSEQMMKLWGMLSGVRIIWAGISHPQSKGKVGLEKFVCSKKKQKELKNYFNGKPVSDLQSVRDFARSITAQKALFVMIGNSYPLVMEFLNNTTSKGDILLPAGHGSWHGMALEFDPNYMETLKQTCKDKKNGIVYAEVNGSSSSHLDIPTNDDMSNVIANRMVKLNGINQELSIDHISECAREDAEEGFQRAIKGTGMTVEALVEALSQHKEFFKSSGVSRVEKNAKALEIAKELVDTVSTIPKGDAEKKGKLIRETVAAIAMMRGESKFPSSAGLMMLMVAKLLAGNVKLYEVKTIEKKDLFGNKVIGLTSTSRVEVPFNTCPIMGGAFSGHTDIQIINALFKKETFDPPGYEKKEEGVRIFGII